MTEQNAPQGTPDRSRPPEAGPGAHPAEERTEQLDAFPWAASARDAAPDAAAPSGDAPAQPAGAAPAAPAGGTAASGDPAWYGAAHSPEDSAWYGGPARGAADRSASTSPLPAMQPPSAPSSPQETAVHATPAAPRRRGPGWGGVSALVVAGMLLSSGATLGGVVAYDQLLSPDSEVAAQSPSTTGADARPAAMTSDETPDWAAVAETVSSSAVAIQVSTAGGTSEGTGVVLDADGSILTNNHVIDGGQAIQVTTAEGRSYSASVVGADATTDLAVLRIDSPPDGLQAATFADSSTVAVGQPVMALGTPLGLENTVTTGIVSAVDRPVTATGEESDGSDATYTSALQTDAAINPGNSGGPLVDAAGQVIGINTAIAGIPNESGTAGSIGLGFAIPANTARMIAEQLLEDGTAEHAFLGVTSTDGSATQQRATYHGAEVVRVEPDSPASGSGLREGDLIIGVDDTPVGGAAALTGVVRGLEVGSTHTLEIVRDGAVETIEVALGVSPS
ncbi:S1C family serine protease [Brachybacterium saurashtrense]|nr:trypsin-like peptidase domain-containing protein [Brachybacterium saurashtrense]